MFKPDDHHQYTNDVVPCTCNDLQQREVNRYFKGFITSVGCNQSITHNILFESLFFSQVLLCQSLATFVPRKTGRDWTTSPRPLCTCPMIGSWTESDYGKIPSRSSISSSFLSCETFSFLHSSCR